jgi:hypothetical protein
VHRTTDVVHEQNAEASSGGKFVHHTFVPEPNDISAALFRATGNRSVPRTTMSLFHLRGGQIVGTPT